MRYFLSIILISAALLTCNDNKNTNNNSEPSPFDESPVDALVTWVVDGDTFFAAIDRDTATIRVLYIDTYETEINERLEGQAKDAGISVDSALALGKEAKNYAIDLLKDETVTLIRDEDEYNKDIYDRYLRAVEINGMRYDSLIKAKGLSAP